MKVDEIEEMVADGLIDPVRLAQWRAVNRPTVSSMLAQIGVTFTSERMGGAGYLRETLANKSTGGMIQKNDRPQCQERTAAEFLFDMLCDAEGCEDGFFDYCARRGIDSHDTDAHDVYVDKKWTIAELKLMLGDKYDAVYKKIQEELG